MKKLPILIFILLCLTAMSTSCRSYRKVERNIENDLKQALAKTINEKTWKQCAKTLYAPIEALPAQRER